MKIEYVWLIGLSVIISTVISTLLSKRFILQILYYSAAVSEGIIKYYECSDEEDKECCRDVVAQALSLDFGTNQAARKWLAATCTDTSGICDDCILWTCPGKEQNNEN